jgi:hypothetical protein
MAQELHSGQVKVSLSGIGFPVESHARQTLFRIGGLRDFGLSLGALALGRLSREFNPKPFGI